MFHTVITPNLYFVLVLFPLFSPKDKKFFITIPTIYTHWPIINNQLIKNNTLVPIQQYDVSNLLDKHSKHVLLRYYLLSYSQTSQTPPTLHHRSVSSHCRSSFFFPHLPHQSPFIFSPNFKVDYVHIKPTHSPNSTSTCYSSPPKKLPASQSSG